MNYELNPLNFKHLVQIKIPTAYIPAINCNHLHWNRKTRQSFSRIILKHCQIFAILNAAHIRVLKAYLYFFSAVRNAVAHCWKIDLIWIWKIFAWHLNIWRRVGQKVNTVAAKLLHIIVIYSLSEWQCVLCWAVESVAVVQNHKRRFTNIVTRNHPDTFIFTFNRKPQILSPSFQFSFNGALQNPTQPSVFVYLNVLNNSSRSFFENLTGNLKGFLQIVHPWIVSDFV